MRGEVQVRALLQQALQLSTADQTEVMLITGENALTRLAENEIHQNVTEQNARLSVKAIIGKKIGQANTNDLSEPGIKKVVKNALAFAKLSKPDANFVSLPTRSHDKYPVTMSFSPYTAQFTPEEKADKMAIIAKKAQKLGLNAAGALNIQVGEIGIANSLGISAFEANTRVSAKNLVMSDNSSGMASAHGVNIDQIDFKSLADRAIYKCQASEGAISVEPGKYDVILESGAVGNLFMFFLGVGFNPVLVKEGRSFIAHKIGKKIISSKLSIWDDATDSRGLPQSFDFEGLPKQKINIIENGRVINMVYNHYAATLAKKRSTGHATPSSIIGGFPTNIFIKPGTHSLEEMIASTKRGILVTRFHYCNLLHPLKVVVTGMTRDGTFLIEDGKIKAPIFNMRFTQGVLEALNHVDMVGDQLECLGRASLPALKIKDFTFTGKAKH